MPFDLTALLVSALVCLAVGLLIGWCGVAGFLLPMFFTGGLSLPVGQALAISFVLFAVSGALGAWNYRRMGLLPLRPALYLGVGSLLGALLGALAGGVLPPQLAKQLLYLVVLGSGASILLRRNSAGTKTAPPARFLPLCALGLVTGLICALSGAGGPVLVMPLLVVLGFPVHSAVGIALLDSVFIALPAAAVYLSKGAPPAILLAVGIAAHGLGVLAGSRTASRIPGGFLKKLVGVFSVCIAVYMLVIR